MCCPLINLHYLDRIRMVGSFFQLNLRTNDLCRTSNPFCSHYEYPGVCQISGSLRPNNCKKLLKHNCDVGHLIPVISFHASDAVACQQICNLTAQDYCNFISYDTYTETCNIYSSDLNDLISSCMGVERTDSPNELLCEKIFPYYKSCEVR